MWKTVQASQVVFMVKNLPANIEDIRKGVQPLGQEDSPGGRNGNPLQYSCLENPMDRGSWWATVHGVAKSCTQLKQLNIQHTENPIDVTKKTE